MASKIDSEDAVPVNDAPQQQSIQDVQTRLGACADKIKLCQAILDDLKDLDQILARKTLHDVAFPLQK